MTGRASFAYDAPGVLGFDSDIDWYCQNGGNSMPDRGRRRLSVRASNATEAEAQAAEEAEAEAMGDGLRASNVTSRGSRRLDAWSCMQASRNILNLFGNNVHNTVAGYNSCRNLEWQVCAAKGMLPGQQSPTIIFATAPRALAVDGARPLGKCGGYHPRGCGYWAYANDDIFFLEACIYAKICANAEELFRLRPAQRFTCQVTEAGFRELQELLTKDRPGKPDRKG